MQPDPRSVVALAHQAATDPAQWQAALTELARLFRADGATIFTPVYDPTYSNVLAIYGDEWQASCREYFKHWVTVDPYLQVMARRPGLLARAGDARISAEILPDAEYKKTAYCNDYARHFGVMGCKLTLKLTDAADPFSPVTHVTLGRTFARNEPFELEDKRRLLALWPELQRAVHSHWRMSPAREIADDAQGALDVLAHPAWALREDARIEYANRAAQSLMRSANAWCVASGGRVHQIGDLDQAMLSQMLRSAAMGVVMDTPILYEAEGQLCRAVLKAGPLAESALFAKAWPCARGLLTLELPPQNWASRCADRVALHHKLTPMETKVLHWVATGFEVEQIAVQMQVSRRTVTTHLQAIFNKTGRRRQSELVRLVLGG